MLYLKLFEDLLDGGDSMNYSPVKLSDLSDAIYGLEVESVCVINKKFNKQVFDNTDLQKTLSEVIELSKNPHDYFDVNRTYISFEVVDSNHPHINIRFNFDPLDKSLRSYNNTVSSDNVDDHNTKEKQIYTYINAIRRLDGVIYYDTFKDAIMTEWNWDSEVLKTRKPQEKTIGRLKKFFNLK